MDSISEWKDYVLYKNSFDHTPEILKRFKWDKVRDCYMSKQHPNGEPDSQGGYVMSISREHPEIVHHYGAKGSELTTPKNNVEVIKLKQLSEGTDYFTALRDAAQVCGLSVPTTFSEEDIKRHNEEREAREAARSAMAKALWADTPEAKVARDYLHSRKWTDEEIAGRGMGLCTKEIVEAHKDAGIFYKRNSTDLNPLLWTTNRLALPQMAGDRLTTIAFRRTDEEKEHKYIYAANMEKGRAFFNIGYNRELVIVEGVLDAMKAQAMGATNVVAAGGEPSVAQITDAVKRGVRVITLLFDKDEAGDSFIKPTIKKIRGLNEEVRVYVGELPESQDLDEYLTERGMEAYKNDIIKPAKTAARWEYDFAVTRAVDAMKAQGLLTERIRDDLLEEVAVIYSNPKTPLQDLGFIKEEIPKMERDFKLDSGRFEELLKERREKEVEKDRNAEIGRKVAEIGVFLDKGEGDRARKLLKEVADRARMQRQDEEYYEDFGTKTARDIFKLVGEVKDGIPTGFVFKGKMDGHDTEEKLTLNSGITFICAPRGHGKTSLLNCMALNEARRIRLLGTGESVLYFSYEISKRRLWGDIIKAFVNDPYMNERIDGTIRHFCRNFDDEKERGRYITGRHHLPKNFELPPYDCFNGKRPENLTHKEYFEEMQKVFSAYIEDGILKVIDRNRKVEDLLTGLRRYIREGDRPVSVVFVDYAQLIYSENWTQRREEEIKKVVHQIKDFSEESGIPFVMAAQFNRQVLSPASVDTTNIGEGGDFERIADTIIGLYNLKELKQRGTKEDPDKTIRELLVKAGAVKKMDLSTFPLEAMHGKIFAALLKRRYGEFPLYTTLDFIARTKYIPQNDPNAAYEIPMEELTDDLYKDDADNPISENW